MKRNLLLPFVLIFTAFACTKDDTSLFNAEMSAKIDDTSWNTTTRATILEDNKFVITGATLDGKTLAITIFGDSEDTYIIGTNEGNSAAVYKESPTASFEDTFVAVSGEVELTSVDMTSKEISGTFHFTMVRNLTTTISVEEGKFSNLKFQTANQ